jgi:hypothetical protein
LLSAALLAVLGMACGNGDKKPRPGSVEPSGSVGAATQDFGSLVAAVFSTGLERGQQRAGLEPGDETLVLLLPPAEDFPAGFTYTEPIAFKAAATWCPSLGATEMAIAFASREQSEAPVLELLTAWVLKPDDESAVEGVLASFEGIEKEIEAVTNELRSRFGSVEGTHLAGLEVLDATSGLGEGAIGLEMTIELRSGSTSGDGLADLYISMRMYTFVRGGYIGFVVRVADTQNLEGEMYDLDLANIVDESLRSAS